MKRSEAYWPLILLLAMVKFVLPLFYQSPVYELHRDEFLYYQQGLHLAFGYLENPPLISYLATISSWFGGSEAMIKLWPCLFGAGTLVLTCLIAAELGGRLFAQFLAGIGILGGAFMRVHFLFQPNFLEIFFWTLSLYYLLRYLNEKKPVDLYVFIVAMALGFWSKYSVLFLAASVIPALLLSRHRIIFKTIHFYKAVLLGLLLIIPNILWQYTHNWPLLTHMKELQETQLQYRSSSDFLGSQLTMLLPATILWVTGLIWVARKKEWRFLFWTYVIFIAILLLGRGKSYYALGIYPVLIAAGAVVWENRVKPRPWTGYALSAVIIFLIWFPIPFLLPIWKPEKLAEFYREKGFSESGNLKWEDQQYHALPQDFADMLGWKELTKKAEDFYTGLPDSVKSNTSILCSNYGIAGALNYYGQGEDFKSKLFSPNGSFLLWIPDDFSTEHVLYIGETRPPDDAEPFRHFEKAETVETVTDSLSRQFNTKLVFYSNARPEFNPTASEILNKLKARFRR